MLNSAAGVTLPPSKKPPPISTICLMRPAIFGSRISASATLVSGPSAHSVTVPLGSRHQRLDDEVDRMLLLQRHVRLRQVGAVQAGLAMHLLGGDQRPHQRADGAGENPGFGPAGQLADLARVLLGQLQRHVAGDGGDPQHLELGAGQRQQDGEGVVLPRVGVDDDLAASWACPLLAGSVLSS